MMLDWIKSWSLAGWVLAIVGGIGLLLVLNFVFGAETLKEWVAAIWGARP